VVVPGISMSDLWKCQQSENRSVGMLHLPLRGVSCKEEEGLGAENRAA
jgi:hypothetical protein